MNGRFYCITFYECFFGQTSESNVLADLVRAARYLETGERVLRANGWGDEFFRKDVEDVIRNGRRLDRKTYIDAVLHQRFMEVHAEYLANGRSKYLVSQIDPLSVVLYQDTLEAEYKEAKEYFHARADKKMEQIVSRLFFANRLSMDENRAFTLFTDVTNYIKQQTK
jgi:hypothetical protein